jgi:hypothetical protein
VRAVAALTHADGVPAAARRVARTAPAQRLLRAGLASRALVFVLLGYLVARVASGALGPTGKDEPASLPGVAQALAAQPGGRAILAVLAVGLFCYAAFSLVDAVLHHNTERPAAKRWGDRLLSAWGVVMYAGLGTYSFVVALSSVGRSTPQHDAQQKAHWSATVLRWPGGQFWLAAAGGVLLAIAGFLVSRACRRSFRPRLNRDDMSERTWLVANALGVAGYVGRAMLFGVVGGCIMSAAIENDPAHGQGVDGSVRILAADGLGRGMLWVLATLLVLYGGYVFVEARYRQVA